jgi:hypothetical protein
MDLRAVAVRDDGSLTFARKIIAAMMYGLKEACL